MVWCCDRSPARGLVLFHLRCSRNGNNSLLPHSQMHHSVQDNSHNTLPCLVYSVPTARKSMKWEIFIALTVESHWHSKKSIVHSVTPKTKPMPPSVPNVARHCPSRNPRNNRLGIEQTGMQKAQQAI